MRYVKFITASSAALLHCNERETWDHDKSKFLEVITDRSLSAFIIKRDLNISLKFETL